jgi:hypothetical protein
MSKIRSIPFLLLVLVAAAPAAVRHIPIKSGVVLNPGETYTAQIDASAPVEIAWTVNQAKPCTTNCIQATELTRDTHFGFATALGGSKEYPPVSGKIAVEYKNISQQPVTIDVYRIQRTCEAEACRFFDSTRKGRTQVFKIDEFKSITTSSDGSYSVISGVAMSGRSFRVRIIWWSDDPKAFYPHCTRWIKGYIDNHTPKEQYRPYVISGVEVGDGDNLVLKSVDDCVPNAPHFGVFSEDEVFK